MSENFASMQSDAATHGNTDAYEHLKECLRIEVLNRDGKKQFS